MAAVPPPPPPPPPPRPPPAPPLFNKPLGPYPAKKWATVEVDEPGKKVPDKKVYGAKLPELVFPKTEERDRVKVFRFLKPPNPGTPSPERPARVMTPAAAIQPPVSRAPPGGGPPPAPPPPPPPGISGMGGPPPAPPPPPPPGISGMGGPRKWATVEVDQPTRNRKQDKHMGLKLPQLIFPKNSEERARHKVFRFLKPPTPSPEKSAGGAVCCKDPKPLPPLRPQRDERRPQSPSYNIGQSPYPPPPSAAYRPQSEAYPLPPSAAYRPQSEAYPLPPSAAYRPQSEAYPLPPSAAYRPQSEAYPAPPSAAYRPQSEAYPPPPSAAYPPPSAAYPRPPSAAYPPPTAAYPPPTETYPPPTAAYPPPTAAYPPPTAAIPPPTAAFRPPSEAYIRSPSVDIPPPRPTAASPPPTAAHPPPTAAFRPPSAAYIRSPSVDIPPPPPSPAIPEVFVFPTPPLNRMQETQILAPREEARPPLPKHIPARPRVPAPPKLREGPRKHRPVQEPTAQTALRLPPDALGAEEFSTTNTTLRAQPPASGQRPLPPLKQNGDFSQPLDYYVQSERVFLITEDTFDKVLPSKTVAMVMFYDPLDSKSDNSKKYFKRAAERANDPSHHFAAVDCVRERDFCASLNVDILPTFKIYSKGKVLSTIRETSGFDDTAMTQYIDTLTSIRQPPQARPIPQEKPKSKCTMARMFGFKK